MLACWSLPLDSFCCICDKILSPRRIVRNIQNQLRIRNTPGSLDTNNRLSIFATFLLSRFYLATHSTSDVRRQPYKCSRVLKGLERLFYCTN